MLKVVDGKWMEHLDHMDMLREGIGLRAFGQKNPLIEYKSDIAVRHETRYAHSPAHCLLVIVATS